LVALRLETAKLVPVPLLNTKLAINADNALNKLVNKLVDVALVIEALVEKRFVFVAFVVVLLPAVRLVTVVVESVVVPVTTMLPVVVELLAFKLVMKEVVAFNTFNVVVPVELPSDTSIHLVLVPVLESTCPAVPVAPVLSFTLLFKIT
jgi:hypothetical protein